MNEPVAQPRISVCPSCRAAMSPGSMVCGSCGGIVAVEDVADRLRSRLRRVLADFDARYGERAAILWILALTPILMGPPVVALLMIFAEMRTPADGRRPDRSFVVVAAVVNILLGILFWRSLGANVLDHAHTIWLWLRSLGVGAGVKTLPV